MNKSLLRKAILGLRKQLSNADHNSMSERISDLITISDEYLKSNNIALYMSFRKEVETKFILEQAHIDNKNCFLPVLEQDNRLSFYKYKKNSELIYNKYKILEPIKSNNKKININELDIIFMPLTAFDLYGNRLGAGAGYYDRTLANVIKQDKRPTLIGLGFDIQKVDNIPTDEWDIKLDAVATEKEFLKFNPKNLA